MEHQSFPKRLPDAEPRDFLAELHARLITVLVGAAGRWHADSVRLRFAATRPGV